ncbi:hypothetical protein B0H12DRAFT_1239230 [Mycena haematopus]|nr:hypothetical protein B0H12DRAFT_1239230 [Mycena haematopus]
MTTPLSRDDSPDSPPPLREASPSLWTRSRSTNVIHSCSHSISPAGTARNDRRVGGSTYPSSPPPQRASPPAMVAMDSELHARAPSSRLKRSPTPANASAQFRAKGKQLPYPILKCCRLPPTAAVTDAHRRCVGILAGFWHPTISGRPLIRLRNLPLTAASSTPGASIQLKLPVSAPETVRNNTVALREHFYHFFAQFPWLNSL